jgi:histone acetyltransferase (RNA polymerase elongator complex component)
MKPILLEVVTKVMTSFDQCRRCKIFFDQTGLNQKLQQKEIDEYPPDLREENRKLSDWMRELNRLYKHRLSIRLIDAPSLLGIYKSLRHRIRTYPTFIVEGKETYAGWDKSQLESLLDKYIKDALPSKHRNLQPSLS